MNEVLIRNAVYAFSQIVCAQIEAMGMAAENHIRHARCEYPAYTHDDFMAILDKYNIHHNAILTTMQE